jgi:hypothetical protein
LNLPTDDGAQLLRGGGLQQTCSSCLIFLALVAMVRCSQYPSLHSFDENMARQIFSFSFRTSL